MLDEAAPTLGSTSKDEYGKNTDSLPVLRGFTRADAATGTPITEMSPTSRIKAKVNTAEIRPSAALQKFLSLGGSASVPVFASNSMQVGKHPANAVISRPPLPPKESGSITGPLVEVNHFCSLLLLLLIILIIIVCSSGIWNKQKWTCARNNWNL